jgi:plasmid segregation protein ParM
MPTSHPTVRAIDVGYGHVKYTNGRDQAGHVQVDSFPSQSPRASSDQNYASHVMHRRDTHLIRIGDVCYEVGKDVALARGAHHEGEVLDASFALSDVYAARLFGAINYMLPTLPAPVIDYLVLGLPLTTIKKLAKDVSKKFTGPLTINARGDVVTVRHCEVYPQPLGAYASYIYEQARRPSGSSTARAPRALICDPGYNTVDWFVCQGMNANETRSNATLRGVSAFLRAVAEGIAAKSTTDVSVTELVQRLDEALVQQRPCTLFGKPFDYQPYLPAGDAVLTEAAQAIKNAIGSGADIDIILVAGGGASLYAKAIQDKFPSHQLVTVLSPAFANVRGFHLIGDNFALSAHRAAKLATQPAAA